MVCDHAGEHEDAVGTSGAGTAGANRGVPGEDDKGCGGSVRGMGEIKNPFPKVIKYYVTID